MVRSLHSVCSLVVDVDTLRARMAVALVLGLAACSPDVIVKFDTDDKVDDTGPGPLADNDGDGYTVDGGDCSDDNAEVYPGADEICDDGLDNDCDPLTVDETIAWYVDNDGDGYGDDSDVIEDCGEMPSDSSPVAGDCDDTDGTVNPDAEDVCDGEDNDCDGVADPDVPTWYRDADSDGYGDAGTTEAGCEAPEGYVASQNDCDDTESSVYPGALEICNSEDDDCDGEIDEDAADAPTWYADMDGDGYGNSLYTEEKCDAPTGYVDNLDDCDDTDPAFNPAADESDCTDLTDYNCDGYTGLDDNDGDGYSACLECDDGDADVNPGAPEECNGEDDDCDALTDEEDDSLTDGLSMYVDADNDGYGTGDLVPTCDPDLHSSVAGDCDDGNDDANPGEIEVCATTDLDGDGDVDADDAVDEDCDGAADSDDSAVMGETDWHSDADADGYGSRDTVVRSCYRPDSSWMTGTGDCDDDDASINEGADELCDGVDNDCDYSTDENDAIDASTWYADADADGFGDVGDSYAACEAPDGFVADNTDCDDTESTTYPDATETCDGYDDDCDGAADNGDGDGDGADVCSDCDDGDASVLASETLYTDADGDGFGDATSTATVCPGTDGYSEDGTDCDDGDNTSYPGAEEVAYDGADNDCDASTSDDDLDGDGEDSTVTGGTDCDDDNEYVNTAATESITTWDDDCDGTKQQRDGSTTYRSVQQSCWVTFTGDPITDEESSDFLGGTVGSWMVDAKTDATASLSVTYHTWSTYGLYIPSLLLPQPDATSSFEMANDRSSITASVSPSTTYAFGVLVGNQGTSNHPVQVWTKTAYDAYVAGDVTQTQFAYDLIDAGGENYVVGAFTTSATQTSETIIVMYGQNETGQMVVTHPYWSTGRCR